MDNLGTKISVSTDRAAYVDLLVARATLDDERTNHWMVPADVREDVKQAASDAVIRSGATQPAATTAGLKALAAFLGSVESTWTEGRPERSGSVVVGCTPTSSAPNGRNLIRLPAGIDLRAALTTAIAAAL